MPARGKVLPWISLFVVYLVWGSTYLGIRVAVASIPPYLMTGCRYIIAGSLLFGLQWLFTKEKPPMPTREQFARIAITAVLLLVIGNGLLCVVETRQQSGTSALLIASTPIWMVLLDSLRARRMPGAAAFAGMAVGTVGIVELVGMSPSHADALLSALLLLASLSWAVGSIYASDGKHHPFTAALEMTMGGFFSLAVALALGETAHFTLAGVTAQSLWGMLWLITAGAMLGYSAYAYVVRTLPAPTVATYAYVNPIVAVILGVLILREPVTWHVAGGAAIVASVVLILVGSRKTAQEAVAGT
ncbi:MAG TPA: EamA family transporter [Candidatus Baltobacteraceae bacterium]|jgi:drug/metabolite transporter (DMT)-like permease|nr:EamA family transporter [Candidatus Baltobacteraceae bacterium]